MKPTLHLTIPAPESTNRQITKKLSQTGKSLLFILSLCCVYLCSLAQDSCNIVPKFEWRQDTSNCKKVWFINQSTPISPNVKFSWKFGDGGTSSDINPSHTYNQAGSYNVCLVIESGTACRKELCKTITISCDTCALTADFSYQKEASQPNKVYFQSTVTNPPGTVAFYSWTFGDGTVSDAGNPTHIYANNGTYNACLKVYLNSSCIKTVCKTIVIGDSCTLNVNFEYQREPSQPNRIYFQGFVNAPLDSIASYLWDFGDGQTSTVGNPTHLYTQNGTYNACLKVLLKNGCEKKTCKAIVIGNSGDSCTLQVQWYSVPDSSNARKIKFINQTIVPSANVQYKWTFGDGTTSADRDVVHVYEKPGVYKVCLWVAISNSCARELCKEIRVDSSQCALQSKFEWRYDSLQKNKVYFINQTQSNQPNVHYIWKFGDGTTSNETNPTHIYQQAGVYEVCLVSETNGCRSEYCKKVEIGSVICNLEPKFEWQSSTEDPRKVYFKNQTIVPSTGAHYIWKFGDGTTSTEKDPVHLYDKPGSYEVCLIVELNDVCRKSVCQKITIAPPNCDIHAKFEWKKDAQNWKKIWFANLSNPVPHIWRTYWTYGDGTASQDFNTFHEYAQSGKYYVCLKVISLTGCIDSYCDSVVVRGGDSCVNRSGFKYERALFNPLEYKFKPDFINLTWKYAWKFGDGHTSTAITPIHKYEKPGLYTVCLTVTQNNGCVTTTCKAIQIGPDCANLQVKYEYKREENKPNKIHFKAISNQPIVKQKWTIKKDSTILGFPYTVVLNENNPTFIFPFAGWYTVCLEAVTANGCVKTYCERILIDRLSFVQGSVLPISIFPNPARTSVRLQLTIEKETAISVTLMDGSGAVKEQWQVKGYAGNNTITVPVEKLSQGQYLVQLTYANQVRWAKFQKM